mmetsp:Transcript_75001/g.178348  ORF Transcript_75001/g.178348 Transcript_75001/m.178348 type:complete len:108 (+) Transcript_75001:227-550(+)
MRMKPSQTSSSVKASKWSMLALPPQASPVTHCSKGVTWSAPAEAVRQELASPEAKDAEHLLEAAAGSGSSPVIEALSGVLEVDPGAPTPCEDVAALFVLEALIKLGK